MNATTRHRILHALDQLEQHAHSRRVDDVAIVSDIDPGEAKAALDHLPRGIVDPTRAEGSAGRQSPRAGAGGKGQKRANIHPTVKPLALMRWLVRLVTPPGGLVIDPYTGSGTTGVAAVCEGMRFAGAELDTWHGVLAHERIAYAMGHGPSGFEDVAEGDDDDDNGADVVPMQAALPLGG